MKKYLLLICLAPVLIVLPGCLTPVGVEKVSARRAYERLNESALNSSHCSAATMRVLNRHGLEEPYEKNPDTTLAKLQTIACTDDRRDLLYALAELNYQNADRQRRSVKPGVSRLARDSYFASAVYAYLYLFGDERDSLPDPFDDRVHVATGLYNWGLTQGLIVNSDALVDLAPGPRQTPPGVMEVQFTQPNLSWKPDMIKQYYAANEFLVRGLSTRNRDSGLGAPLIALTDKIGRFKEVRRAPGTVFLRVSGNVRDWSAGKLSATLELYAAFDTPELTVNGKSVPLQTDTTAPLALGLNDSPIWSLGLGQFFSSSPEFKTGIRLMQPYEPGRIPVVFVHGTASSPVWWAEMWNTLRADPVLRKRYQYWMFNYATGNPITYSALRLRDELMTQVKILDPEGKDAALQHMVVIGHSQGGLLAKLTATDTGDKLWKLSFKTNIDELKIDVSTRELLRSNFFFKPLPCVSRVIFISTPHRGSYVNTSFVQRFLNRFMKFPKELMSASANLLKSNDTTELPPGLRRGVPSSLNGMSVDNPFMLTLADIPVAPSVKANSIIAIKGDDQPPNGADGVVQYKSAHVDYTESEFIVRSGHSCQGNPLTIEEVRRILLENFETAEGAGRAK